MYILKSRPLAAILIVLLGGFSLFSVITPLFRVIAWSALTLTSVCVYLFAKGRRHTRFALTLLLLAMLSGILSVLYFEVYFVPEKHLTEKTEIIIEGHVTEVYYTDGYWSTSDVSVSSLDGRAVHSYKIRLQDESGELGRIKPGDAICASVRLSDVRAEDTEQQLYLIGKGIRATATVVQRKSTVLSTHGITRLVYQLRTSFAERAEEASNTDASGLLRALILADKEQLSPKLKLNFKRGGISHILALSGMHLSMLCIACLGLLSFLGVGKRTRTFLLFPLVIAYTVLTGVPTSLLRASVMLLLSSALFLLKQTRDSITTLTVSVFLICLFTPYAVLDIGLWLSALATLGLLFVLEATEPSHERALLRIWKGFLQSFKLTFGALSASLLLSVLAFGNLSLISPIATFIFGYFIQLYMYVGLFAVLTTPHLPFFGHVLTWLYEGIFALSERTSELRYSYVDGSFPVVRVLSVVFTVCLVLYLLLPVRRKRTCILCLSLLFISVYVGAFGMTAHAYQQTKLFYTTYHEQELFILTSKGKTAAVDVGGKGRDFGERTVYSLDDRHISYLDTYILTRYSVYLPQTVESVLSSVRCHTLYVPEVRNEKEQEVYDRLRYMADVYRVELRTYAPREAISVGELTYEVLSRKVEDTKVSLWFYIGKTDYLFSYFSRGSITDKTEAAATEIIARSDAVMFGSCGHSADYILDIPLSEKVKCCILSDEGLRIQRDMLASYKRRTRVVIHPLEYTIIR